MMQNRTEGLHSLFEGGGEKKQEVGHFDINSLSNCKLLISVGFLHDKAGLCMRSLLCINVA